MEKDKEVKTVGILFLGPIGVGKTSIIKKYVKGEFTKMFKSTLHNTSYDKSIYVNGKEFEKFKIYTLEKLDDFIRLIRENTDNWYSILVESQINYQWKDRDVSPEERMEYARKHNLYLCSVSAETGEGINEIFEVVLKKRNPNNRIVLHKYKYNSIDEKCF